MTTPTGAPVATNAERINDAYVRPALDRIESMLPGPARRWFRFKRSMARLGIELAVGAGRQARTRALAQWRTARGFRAASDTPSDTPPSLRSVRPSLRLVPDLASRSRRGDPADGSDDDHGPASDDTDAPPAHDTGDRRSAEPVPVIDLTDAGPDEAPAETSTDGTPTGETPTDEPIEDRETTIDLDAGSATASGPAAAGPAGDPDPGMTKAELYELAKEAGIAGRSSMNKGQLLAALREHRA